MDLLEYNISDKVYAFSTRRHGGFSKGLYSSFNANSYCGDNPVDVSRNKQLLANHLQITSEKIIIPHQVHGDKLLQIDNNFLTQTPTVRKTLLEGVDSLTTSIPGLCICISTADCIPILLYDQATSSIACVHAGWRGTVSRICEKVISSMCHIYSTTPSAIKTIIGPGISLNNFEVGDEVYDVFTSNGFDMSKISVRKDKWHINLFECNRLQMLDCGIKPQNIHVSGICTYDNYKDYFSARRLGINSGRILTGIILK